MSLKIYDTANKVVNELIELKKSGDILPENIKESSHFDNIWKFLDTDEYIGYSPISHYAFDVEEISEFKTALDEAVISTEINKEHTDRARNHFLKILDHIELVGIQSNSIDERQQAKIEQQNKELAKLKSDINISQEDLDNLKNQLKDTREKTEKLTVDFVTILGIFTSITFATFGGLQLLGNVFGNVKNISSSSIGSELMLGSVFLFGTYMILLALLTGISKLMGKNYNTSFPTRFIIVFSFLVIFVFGFVYAKVGYNAKVWSSWINDWTISAIFILSVGVIGLVIDLCYRKNAMIRIKRFVGLRTRYRRCKARHKAKKQLNKPNSL